MITVSSLEDVSMLVKTTKKTIETKIENPKEIEQLSLMNRFIFFKQIFKLTVIQMDRIWRE